MARPGQSEGSVDLVGSLPKPTQTVDQETQKKAASGLGLDLTIHEIKTGLAGFEPAT